MQNFIYLLRLEAASEDSIAILSWTCVLYETRVLELRLLTLSVISVIPFRLPPHIIGWTERNVMQPGSWKANPTESLITSMQMSLTLQEFKLIVNRGKWLWNSSRFLKGKRDDSHNWAKRRLRYWQELLPRQDEQRTASYFAKVLGRKIFAICMYYQLIIKRGKERSDWQHSSLGFYWSKARLLTTQESELCQKEEENESLQSSRFQVIHFSEKGEAKIYTLLSHIRKERKKLSFMKRRNTLFDVKMKGT